MDIVRLNLAFAWLWILLGFHRRASKRRIKTSPNFHIHRPSRIIQLKGEELLPA